jgi:predicted metalloendopeptidase
MNPKTKKKALEKLRKFKLMVSSPEVLSEDPLLDYSEDDEEEIRFGSESQTCFGCTQKYLQSLLNFV